MSLVLSLKFIEADVYCITKYVISFFTEIAKVRASLFQINGVKKEPLVLPEAEGMVTTLTEKVYVPVKEHPDVSSSTSFLILGTNNVERNERKNR